MTARYLLDTNHLSASLTIVSKVRVRLLDVVRNGDRVGTCIPVLCELEAGIQQMHDPDACRRELDRLLKHVRVWPLEREIPRAYGQIYLDLRRRGRVLSQVDIFLAALAQEMNLTLLTSDRDFEALPNIPQQDWTKPIP